jgi:hypothetical protein
MSNGSARKVTGVVAAAMIVALAIWVLARLLGVELTVGRGQDASHVSAADAVVTALLAGLVGLGVRAQLARRRADRSWPYVGGTALAISIIGPGLACRRPGVRGVDHHARGGWPRADRRLHQAFAATRPPAPDVWQ